MVNPGQTAFTVQGGGRREQAGPSCIYEVQSQRLLKVSSFLMQVGSEQAQAEPRSQLPVARTRSQSPRHMHFVRYHAYR
jgi:hypothetical protein